jgi:flagellar biosynthesis/type III secretory pathway M-ring protein FliF/YscJ
MKDLFQAVIPISSIVAMTVEDAPFWERIAEKWGIGLVGMALFIILARWTAKREEKLQEARDEREAAAQLERNALAQRNNELTSELLTQNREHSTRLEQIIAEGNRVQRELAEEIRNIARRVNCPKAHH